MIPTASPSCIQNLREVIGIVGESHKHICTRLYSFILDWTEWVLIVDVQRSLKCTSEIEERDFGEDRGVRES